MLGATVGFFYQKRFVPAGDLRAMTGVQYVGALAVMLPAAFLIEPMHIEWNWTMALVLAWSVLALSIGAIWLLLAADPPRRGLARLGLDLSGAADRGGAGLAVVWRDAERLAARRHGPHRRGRRDRQPPTGLKTHCNKTRAIACCAAMRRRTEKAREA